MRARTVLGGRSRDIRTKRHSTGAIAGGATASITVSWSSAFADTAYTVTASIVDSNADLVIDQITSVTASQFVVRVRNTDTLNAAAGVVHATAVHD
jgi:hypothetical protein